MNFELYIHGATNGQKVLCSKEEDVDYCKNFYANTIKNNNLFRVDIRHNNSYYSFIKYNLIGGDNRRGGYFGITLRIDNNFCDSIDKLYPYFISLYNKYIEGKIIKGDRYSVSDLPEQTRKDIENEFGNILSDLKYSLKPINNSFSKQKGNTTPPSYNIKEISNYNYVAILKKNLSILLSDEFPTKDAILLDTQKELNELKKQLNELNQTIDLYKDQNQKKQSEINTLKETMGKIKGQIEENKSLKSFEDNIKAIETPINNIATYLKQYSENATDGSKKPNTNKLIKKLILPIIIAGLLLANCVMYFRVNSRLKNIETIEQQTETTTTTESSTTKDTTKDNTEEVTQETTNEDNIEAENESPLNHDKNKKNETIKKD